MIPEWINSMAALARYDTSTLSDEEMKEFDVVMRKTLHWPPEVDVKAVDAAFPEHIQRKLGIKGRKEAIDSLAMKYRAFFDKLPPIAGDNS